MKRFFKTTVPLMCILLLGSITSNAQFDDLYYNPVADYSERSYTVQDRRSSRTVERRSNTAQNNESFDNEYYDYADDYDFYYTSRIRRFHRMRGGFGFYDPFFVDMVYYDPFFQPGVTIYVGNGWGWNRGWGWNNPWGWNRGWGWNNPWGWNRGWGWNNPWGWNRGWGWNNPWGWNRGWGWNNPWGWNRGWGWNNPWGGNRGWGWNNPWNCPTGWNNPWQYDNNYRYTRIDRTENQRGTYYGPRNTGVNRTTQNSRATRQEGVNPGTNYDRYPNARRAPQRGNSETEVRGRNGGRTPGATNPTDRPSTRVRRPVVEDFSNPNNEPGRRNSGRIEQRNRINRTSPSGNNQRINRSERRNESRINRNSNRRRSIFSNPSSRNSNRSRSVEPRRNRSSSNGINRSNRSRQSSGLRQNSSRSSRRSSGSINRSRSNSRSSGSINRGSSRSRSSGSSRSGGRRRG